MSGLFKFIGSHAPGFIGGAVAVGTAVSSYSDDRARGRNIALSVGDAALQTIAWASFPTAMMALSVAKSAPMVNQAYQQWLGNYQRGLMPFYDDGAANSMAAQTSRARGQEAIGNSRANARNYIGREAGLFSARYR